ncbi:hypothetical protein SASPL_118354 [Salvia splendens]|uniref:Uncharacterized protein n=1 Tax=Salvia splendens TaxID=180675 RepID=A0A8X8ZYD6_SALSN|nr:hypothetical protein SASPL_118354 [Salvia splendens]
MTQAGDFLKVALFLFSYPASVNMLSNVFGGYPFWSSFGDGSGCVSIYGSKLDDENFIAKILLTWATVNGMLHYILCKLLFFMVKIVVLQVKRNNSASRRNLSSLIGDGLLIARKIENVATGPGSNNRPKLACVIAECGEM